MGHEAPTSRSYPRQINVDGETYEIALMKPADMAAVSAFVATLPTHDLLFLNRDITNPKVMAAWMQALRDGRVISLVLRQDGKIVGTTAIVTEELTWSGHVGNLRVLLGDELRGKGLGRVLVQESFALGLERGLKKMCVRMTADQQSAIAAFEGLGFRPEAVLRKHVKDRDGKLHDLVILSHDVDTQEGLMQAYGVGEATNA